VEHRRAREVRVEILELHGERAPDVVDVLSEAFFDYPVMRFVIGPNQNDYEACLRRLVGLFVMARVLREEHLLGIPGTAGLDAAAIVSRPGGGPAPDAFRPLAEEVWNDLGAAARARYEAFGKACAPFQIEEPHLHLNMIGTRRRAKGAGPRDVPRRPSLRGRHADDRGSRQRAPVSAPGIQHRRPRDRGPRAEDVGVLPTGLTRFAGQGDGGSRMVWTTRTPRARPPPSRSER
jgi:hypothetical protein